MDIFSTFFKLSGDRIHQKSVQRKYKGVLELFRCSCGIKMSSSNEESNMEMLTLFVAEIIMP